MKIVRTNSVYSNFKLTLFTPVSTEHNEYKAIMPAALGVFSPSSEEDANLTLVVNTDPKGFSYRSIGLLTRDEAMTLGRTLQQFSSKSMRIGRRITL